MHTDVHDEYLNMIRHATKEDIAVIEDLSLDVSDRSDFIKIRRAKYVECIHSAPKASLDEDAEVRAFMESEEEIEAEERMMRGGIMHHPV